MKINTYGTSILSLELGTLGKSMLEANRVYGHWSHNDLPQVSTNFPMGNYLLG